MLTRCHTWDLGPGTPPVEELTQRLQEVSHTEAILVSSKTSFPDEWNQVPHCLLLWGPTRYARLYTHTPLPEQQATEHDRLHERWLSAFRKLREEAESGADTKQSSQKLMSEISDRLLFEEQEIHAKTSEAIGFSRTSRELGYEHQGIRRFLPRLPEALELLRQSDPRARATWSKLALDLVHLLEHHAEHERGIFVAHEAFCL